MTAATLSEIGVRLTRRRLPFPAAFAGRLLLAVMLLAGMLLSGVALGADAPVTLGSYPLPVAETAEVVESYLADRGFEVTEEMPAGGRLAVQAKGRRESLRVMIDSRSPLGSVIEIYAPPAAHSTVDGLKDALARYVAKLQTGKPSPRAHAIFPAAVAPHADAVLCLQSSAGGEAVALTGFVVDRRGFILTTAHNLDGVTIISSSGREGALKGAVVRRDAARDLSLVKTERHFDSAVAVAEGKRELKEGARVFAIGCSSERVPRLLSGTVGSRPALVGGQPLWQVDMDVSPGTSGSPAFDADGRLVGVVKGRYRGTQRRAFLIPLDTVRAFLEKGSR